MHGNVDGDVVLTAKEETLTFPSARERRKRPSSHETEQSTATGHRVDGPRKRRAK